METTFFNIKSLLISILTCTKCTVALFCRSSAKKTERSIYCCKVACDSQLPGKTFKKESRLLHTSFFERLLRVRKHCIGYHDGRTCYLPDWGCHSLLIGDIEELLQKMNAFGFRFQHEGCLHKNSKYRFEGNILPGAKNCSFCTGNSLFFKQRNSVLEKMPGFAKKESLGRRTKRFSLAL